MEFTETEAYSRIKEFILQINNSIKEEEQISIDNEIEAVNVLLKIKEIILSTKLSEKKGRYTNPGMVDVIEKIERITENVYLLNSFGNKLRLDFGTGHELNFLCYLYTLFYDSLEACRRANEKTCNTTESQIPKKRMNCYAQFYAVLQEYFEIIRIYVAKFNIEAAGSRGCWSIDDYLLLPYVFGSAENFYNPQSISHIFKGVFKREYEQNKSTILRNLCKKEWPEINTKLFLMYDSEVLGRHVVTQHFIFSEYLPSKRSV